VKDQPLTGMVSKTANDPKLLNLKRGSVVFAPSQKTLVSTPFGTVKIEAHSLVMVMAFCHGLAVYDLDDAHGKAVVVTAGNREFQLNPGRHVLIAHESKGSFADINPVQIIGFRDIREQNIGRGLKGYTAAFSLPHAMSAIIPIKQLVASEHAHARKVANHLLKTTAILKQLDRSSYEQVFRPQVTAYNN
jgi:hypothetical protein